MREPIAARNLYEKINALPVCAGKRDAFLDELRHAERVASDIVAVERFVRELLRRAYDGLTVSWRRAVARRVPQQQR
jgi:hypothetical protein